MGYSEDLRLERRFERTIKAILGLYFVGQDARLDKEEATDFAVYTVAPFSVAARLRTHGYYLRYPDEFTIRWLRPSGVATEIHKIREGRVDYILYGFVDKSERRLIKYFIGDLRVFREHEPRPLCVKWNTPPDSQLAAFRVGDLPPRFILHEWTRPPLPL